MPDLSDQRCPQPITCQKTARCYGTVTVPIKLFPHATVGEITVECCEPPDAVCEASSCGSCAVTVTQKLVVTIPIRYQVTALSGDCAFTLGDEE